MTDSHDKLLEEFLAHLRKEIQKFGASVNTNTANKEDAIKLIVWRFHYILGSLKNALSQKDALVSSLVQRYNYELMIDFYYLIDPSGEKNKVQNFFSHTNEKSYWSSYGANSRKEKEKYIPRWVMNEETTKPLYRKLSNVAHPNIISLTLDTKGEIHSAKITQEAISLCVVMIVGCLNDQRFREMFYQYDKSGQQNSPYFENLEFQNRAINLFNNDRN